MIRIKILVLENRMLSNVAYWRLYHPLSVMKTIYRGLVQFDIDFKRKELDYADAWGADLIVMPRPGGGAIGDQAALNDFLRSARQSGARVVIDLDDHILGIPKDHELYSEFQKPQRRKAIESCLGMADAFWFSSPEFLSTYSTAGIVVENGILPSDMPESPSPDAGIWAWRGRSVQVHDLINAGGETWPEIRDKAKRWLWMGYMPPLPGVENTEVLPYLDNPQTYFMMLRQTPLNGLWKPMMHCSFNDHKSNIAMIEATMAGGVCLTNYSGRPGWQNTVKSFPTYKEACKVWEAAREDIAENYNIINLAQKRASSILALCSHLIPASENANT